MFFCIRFRRWAAVLGLLLCLTPLLFALSGPKKAQATGDFIHWAEFNVPYEALERTYSYDVENEGRISWIDLLAILAAKYGGDWKQYQRRDLEQLYQRVQEQGAESIGEKMKYYPYYRQVYQTVLGEFLGNHLEQTQENGKTVWKMEYGLKVYSPVAGGYWYDHYDDFGASRSYGYKRRHLGHDMMGSVGTPIVAVESGRVEALGWNQYGGWRIGIRSFDGKRYYYYAHLRKDHPYQLNLQEGSIVTGGEVIGYMGRTGYSAKENVNNIATTHLHWGLELIFDESQKESDNELWVDLYAITRLLEKHKSAVEKSQIEKEYVRKYQFIDELNSRVMP